MVNHVLEQSRALLGGAHPLKHSVLLPPPSTHTAGLEMPKRASHRPSKTPGIKVLPPILCLHLASLGFFFKRIKSTGDNPGSFRNFLPVILKPEMGLHTQSLFFSFRMKNMGRAEVASDFAVQ